MAKMLTVEVDDSFAESIDRLISSTKLYSSRSEFLKDSIRKNFFEMMEKDPDLKKLREGAMQLRKIALERGWNGKLISKKQKEKIAIEYMKKRGLM